MGLAGNRCGLAAIVSDAPSTLAGLNRVIFSSEKQDKITDKLNKNKVLWLNLRYNITHETTR
jgi:hypothetical protein